MDKATLLNAGIIYAEGVGVPKSKELAKSLLREAAIKGSGEGMFRYAELLEEEDLETAVWWYLQSAQNGCVEAKNVIGEKLKGKVNTPICKPRPRQYPTVTTDLKISFPM